MPCGVAVTPDGSHVYVANYGDDTVSVIQTSDNTVIETISVGPSPYGMAVTPDGRYVYVGNGNDNTVIQTSNNSVIDTISVVPVGHRVDGVAVTPDGSYVYVSSPVGSTSLGGMVSVIGFSANTPTATITSPSDGTVYTEGDSITFGGSGSDAEDGDLTGSSLVWTSSIDGEIGMGESFTTSDLSVGTHVIILTAIDSLGTTGNESLSITISSISYGEI